MSKEQYYLKLLEKQKEFSVKDKKCINKLLKENVELKDLVKRQVCQAECYRYKQLLAEQAKNKKLVEALEDILASDDSCGYADDMIECKKCDTCYINQKDCVAIKAQQALNEVNNAK